MWLFSRGITAGLLSGSFTTTKLGKPNVIWGDMLDGGLTRGPRCGDLRGWEVLYSGDLSRWEVL